MADKPKKSPSVKSGKIPKRPPRRLPEIGVRYYDSMTGKTVPPPPPAPDRPTRDTSRKPYNEDNPNRLWQRIKSFFGW